MTQRAFLVGTIGLCFYLISVTNNLPAAFSVLTWLALSLLIASAAVALLSLQGLKCRFRVTRGSGAAPWPNQETETENELAPQLEVRLENGGTLNKTGLVLTVKLRAENAAETAPNEAKKSRVLPREYSRRFVVEALTATKSLTALLPLDELPRGVYRVEEIRITGSDVLGLFRVIGRYRAEKCGEGALKISVAPAYLEARAASTRGATEGARRGQRGSDDDLRGTRPYVAGDDLRAVHWKTTARLGRLVVREFDATARRRTFILWNGIAPPLTAASTRAAFAAHSDERAVEQSLRLTMSLCAALEARGDDCALLRMDAPTQRVARSRAGFLTRCGEALCGAAANRTAPLSSSALLKARGAIARGDEMFVVAPRADESLAKLAAAWSGQGVSVTVALLESAAPRASTRNAKNARRQNIASSSAAVPDAATKDDAAATAFNARAADNARAANLSAENRSGVATSRVPNATSADSETADFNAANAAVIAPSAGFIINKSQENEMRADADSATSGAAAALENSAENPPRTGAEFATSGAVSSAENSARISAGSAALGATFSAEEPSRKPARFGDSARAADSNSSTSAAATAPASTRGRVSRNATRDETIKNGAPFFAETTGEFAAQLRAAGARVVVVEAGDDARSSIENAMSEMLSIGSGTRRSARKSADGRAAFAETSAPREAVS